MCRNWMPSAAQRLPLAPQRILHRQYHAATASFSRSAKGAEHLMPASCPSSCPSLRNGLFAAGLAILLVLTAFSDAAAAPQIMRTRDIRPGMRGYGLTVFKGTRVERFPVEVLGVVRSYLAGSDLILIRVTGGYLARHGVGIVAGMSGSPVYVNGRLIGAIGYGWPFSKEPIGGVTPIESMIRDAAPQVASRGKTPAAPRMEARRLAKPIRVGKRTMRSVQIFSAADPDVKRLPKDVLALSPVPSLFQLRGFGERSAAGLEKVLRPLGMEPVRTFSVAATVPRRIPRLGPGAAVGVQLLSGDLEISGTGTLTWIDGKRFLAFGHPLANLGSVRLPFTAAYVQDILPSYQRPFKFATQIGVVGEMAEDRFFGVGGWFGRPSPLIPVRLSLHDGRGLNRTYNLRAAQHQTLAPVVMAQAMMEAMASTIPVAAETTALMKVRIKARGHEAVSFEQMVGGLQLDSSVGLQLFDALSALANNDFAPLFFEQVEVDVSLRAGRQVATIERVYTTRNAYRRGERIDVHVVLKPYDKPTLEKVVTLPIPADTDRGAITIGVAGGADMPALRKRLGQPKPEPNDVDQLLRQLQSQERNQEVVVRATFPTKAAVVNEERFVFLPDALRELLPGMAQSGIGAEKDFVDVRLSTDWVIRGADVVQADVAGAPESQEKGKTVPRGDYVMTPMVVMPTTPTTSPKAAPSEPKRAAGAPVEKTLPTGTRRFDLAGGKVFEQGRFEGTGLSPSGELALASQAAMTPSLDGAFLWTILREPEGTALAGASGGKVVRIDPARGTTSQIAHFPDAAVTALARDNRGTLWAGTSPNGFVYAGGRRVFSAPASYVWALLPDGEGMLAATGNPGRVYRVTAAGAKLQVEVPARHVRALMRTPDGALLAATGGPGTVYRVKDSLETLFVSPYGSVDALARAGDLVAAASGKNVYLIGNGEVRPLLVADKPLLALAAMDDGTLLASGGGGSVYRADLEGGVWRVADLD
ncbi:MAG: hypothetical protein FJX76_20730, partial [Armatimonadetes bacterium]|nr:hypothetical protein [Armatimonadota bacterium]